MQGFVLLAAVTVFYAGYNLFIKVSGAHVPVTASSTIIATIVLQIGALATSLIYLSTLVIRGGHELALTTPAYAWAVVAGICIGAAEIGYLYLFSSVGSRTPMPANVAIPAVVSGTIVITFIVSNLIFKESIRWNQILGMTLVIVGIGLLFINRGAYE